MKGWVVPALSMEQTGLVEPGLTMEQEVNLKQKVAWTCSIFLDNYRYRAFFAARRRSYNPPHPVGAAPSPRRNVQTGNQPEPGTIPIKRENNGA